MRAISCFVHIHNPVLWRVEPASGPISKDIGRNGAGAHSTCARNMLCHRRVSIRLNPPAVLDAEVQQ